MVSALPFSEFEFAAQRSLSAGSSDSDFALEGVRFPLALESDGAKISSLDDFVQSIESLAERNEISPLLNRSGGAVLFRGTHAETPQDFSRVAHAFKVGTYHEEVSPLTSNDSICALVTRN
jgi:hypothetical protein